MITHVGNYKYLDAISECDAMVHIPSPQVLITSRYSHQFFKRLLTRCDSDLYCLEASGATSVQAKRPRVSFIFGISEPLVCLYFNITR